MLYFFAGLVLGLGLSWIIERWIKSFISQLNTEGNKKNGQVIKNNDKYSIHWKFLLIFSIFTALLTSWRQFSAYLFNDIVLITSLAIIAQIDLKTMFIEGKIIAYSIILRTIWLIYFEPQEILTYLAGFVFGSGLLYLVGFFYQTFRKRQGIGDGDASVLGLIGMWLGWQDLGFVLLIAAVSGTIISSFNLLKNNNGKLHISILLKTKIPFAPFLCFGGLVIYFFKEINFF